MIYMIISGRANHFIRKNLAPIKCILYFFLLLTSLPSFSAHYHVDATSGNDETGTGEEQAPWRTFDKAIESASSGDTVIFYDGIYTPSVIRGEEPLFDDWVTFKAAPGATPVLEKLTAVHATSQNGEDKIMRLALDGFHFSDGIRLRDVDQVKVENSFVEVVGPWTGSVDNIEKTAIYLRGSSNITLNNLEITKTGTAINLSNTKNIVIRNSHIHDITHDGIRVVSAHNVLIENNIIQGLNDGVSDQEADWSRHSDAIHIFIHGSSTAVTPNDGILIRGNVLRDVEAQHVQFNNYYRFPEKQDWNRDILFEHNVFGPAVSPNAFNNADPANGLVFRHNTFIDFDASYTSPHEELHNPTINPSGIRFRSSGLTANLQVYNNIFFGNPAVSSDADIYSHNIILAANASDALPRNNFKLDKEMIFAAPIELTDDNKAHILNSSPSINAGYRFDSTSSITDTTPNIGAYSISAAPLSIAVGDIDAYIERVIREGRPSSNTPYASGSASTSQMADDTVLVDDFEDANLNYDRYFEQTSNQVGLQWVNQQSDGFVVSIGGELDRNNLQGPRVNSESKTLLADVIFHWKAIEFCFEANSAYMDTGAGPVMLWQDTNNFYFLDIGIDEGRLWRVRNGQRELLLQDNILKSAHAYAKTYCTELKLQPEGVKFVFYIDEPATPQLIITDTLPGISRASELSMFGFHREPKDQHWRMTYDNISFRQLSPPRPPTNLQATQAD